MGIDAGSGGLIPLDQLTDDENRFIDSLIIRFHQAGNLEAISSERTAEIVTAAKKEGFEDRNAERLAGHFDAATMMVSAMSEAGIQQFRTDVATKVALSLLIPRQS